MPGKSKSKRQKICHYNSNDNLSKSDELKELKELGVNPYMLRYQSVNIDFLRETFIGPSVTKQFTFVDALCYNEYWNQGKVQHAAQSFCQREELINMIEKGLPAALTSSCIQVHQTSSKCIKMHPGTSSCNQVI